VVVVAAVAVPSAALATVAPAAIAVFPRDGRADVVATAAAIVVGAIVRVEEETADDRRGDAGDGRGRGGIRRRGPRRDERRSGDGETGDSGRAEQRGAEHGSAFVPAGARPFPRDVSALLTP
jgi:hypothetical protein